MCTYVKVSPGWLLEEETPKAKEPRKIWRLSPGSVPDSQCLFLFKIIDYSLDPIRYEHLTSLPHFVASFVLPLSLAQLCVVFLITQGLSFVLGAEGQRVPRDLFRFHPAAAQGERSLFQFTFPSSVITVGKSKQELQTATHMTFTERMNTQGNPSLGLHFWRPLLDAP